MENRFDLFTKAMAREMPRRGALRRIGAGLAAAFAVASGSADGVLAAPGGNAACAQWCHDNFQGSDAGHCTSDAALGQGACYQCGPAAPAGSTAMVCNGKCVPSDVTNCGVCGHACPPNSVCSNGTCLSAVTCSDQVQNGAETDVDCGGPTCPKCAQGKKCSVASDCQSGICTGGICTCPDCLTDCSMVAPPGCVATYCPGATSTPTNCGTCGNVCPGYQQPNDNVTCQGGSICTFTCQGEHYDLDNDPANGCERTDPVQGNHIQQSAVPLGSVSCNDSPLSTFSGVILSDRRVHENPAIPGFDAASGSAPDWYSVVASGGAFCSDDIVATITTTGGSASLCYKLTVITDQHTYSTAVSGNGSASISHAGNQYSDGSPIFFKVEKTCSTAIIEAVNYTVSYHL
jgi:hypothetical protein